MRYNLVKEGNSIQPFSNLFRCLGRWWWWWSQKHIHNLLLWESFMIMQRIFPICCVWQIGYTFCEWNSNVKRMPVKERSAWLWRSAFFSLEIFQKQDICGFHSTTQPSLPCTVRLFALCLSNGKIYIIDYEVVGNLFVWLWSGVHSERSTRGSRGRM